MHCLEARIIEVYLLLLACLCKNIRKPRRLARRTLLLHSLLLRIARLNHCVACAPDRTPITLHSLMSSSSSRRRSIIYYAVCLLAFRVGYGVHFESEAHVRTHGRRVTGLRRFLISRLMAPEQKVRRAATSDRLESRIFQFTRRSLFLYSRFILGSRVFCTCRKDT